MAMYIVENRHLYGGDNYNRSIAVPIGIKKLHKPKQYFYGEILLDSDTAIMYRKKDVFSSKKQALDALNRQRKEFLVQNNWEELLPYIEDIVKYNRKESK